MNVIVRTSHLQSSDREVLFGDEDCIYVGDDLLLPNLLVHLGIYKTTSEARRAGRLGEIPKGWNEIKASKKVKIWVWNPFL